MSCVCWRVLAVAIAVCVAGICRAAPEEAVLSAAGTARFPVVVAETASPRVRQTARTLADYLSRISGAPFEVRTGTGTRGLAVGTAAEFPALGLGDLFDAKAPLRRDDYLLRSHADGLYLVGATPTAVSHAAWDLLYRFGHRQYFPTATWEIVPTVTALRIAVDSLETPSFHTRRLGYGHAYWGDTKGRFDAWCRRNRASSEFAMRSGHAYQSIVAANEAVFDAHPEYLALSGGKRVSTKMCLSNPAVQAIVLDHAIRYFEKTPDADCISMEPSDGGGWCECEACVAMGTPSDRATFMANRVAEAINQRYTNKYVGMLAYNEHAMPPAIRVHPNVIVNCTTHQARGPLTLEQRIAGWAKQGAIVGVSDAYGTYVWDHELPNRQHGSDLVYVRESLPHFHELGVRFLSGWTSGSWGAIGLGNYLAARIRWDVREAARADAILSEFLDTCFGPARPPMEKLVRLLYHVDGQGGSPVLTDDFMGRGYRLLDEALTRTRDARVRARIHDLVLYLHYVELYRVYESADATMKPLDISAGQAMGTAGLAGLGEPGDKLEGDLVLLLEEDLGLSGTTEESRLAKSFESPRQKAFEALMRFTYRIRETDMVHGKAFWSYVPGADTKVIVPAETTWGTPEDEHPWKDSSALTDPEIAAILAQGIESNRLLDFTAASYSQDLVPAVGMGLAPLPDGNLPTSRRRVPNLYLWVDKAPANLVLRVIPGGTDPERFAQLTLYVPAAEGEDAWRVVAEDLSVALDGRPHRVVLRTPREGLHRLDFTPAGTVVQCTTPGLPCTIRCGPDAGDPYRPSGWYTVCFYVPKDTQIVAGYAGGPLDGTIQDGEGNTVFDFSSMASADHFRVPVPPGQDGCLWRFVKCRGERRLMTVPPYLARNDRELLLPAEVVEADRGREPSASFETVRYSDDLVPVSRLGLPDTRAHGVFSRQFYDRRSYYLWVAEAPGTIKLRVSTGLYKRKHAGNAKLWLFSAAEPSGKAVAFDDRVPPDGVEREVILETPHAGLHRLDIDSCGDASRVELPRDVPCTLDGNASGGAGGLYFYVPKGTRVIGGHVADRRDGAIRSPDGRAALSFPRMEGEQGTFSVPVPPGQDGKLWRLESGSGKVVFATVPPYLAKSRDDLLLPVEVVEKDAP